MGEARKGWIVFESKCRNPRRRSATIRGPVLFPLGPGLACSGLRKPGFLFFYSFIPAKAGISYIMAGSESRLRGNERDSLLGFTEGHQKCTRIAMCPFHVCGTQRGPAQKQLREAAVFSGALRFLVRPKPKQRCALLPILKFRSRIDIDKC